MPNFSIRQAIESDTESVAALYKSVIGSSGCTWNEFYPSEQEIKEDIAADCLFVMLDRNFIIGAASIVPENELDGEAYWRVNDGGQREIARIAISPEYHGHGYAKIIIGYLLDRLRERGCSTVHLLAAKCNLAAVQTYRNLGFDFVGECFMFGNEYFACEKVLNKPQ